MNCSQKKIVRSSNKEITMASTADKARKARNRAFDQDYPRGASRGGTDELVMDLTRGKAKGFDKLGRYVDAEEQRAANLMQQRRRLDTAKTAARGNAIEKRTAAKKAAKTLITGATGGAAKKQAPKPATKKAAAAKPKTIGTGPNKAKVTPMSPAKKSAKGLPTTGRQNVKKGKK
jgi:hypothetical protein